MMTYYRIALHDRQINLWTWKTTVLNSLQGVFQVLRSYSALPQDCIRVFTAASKEDLNEMLRRENSNLASGSVTAVQFFLERKLRLPGEAQSASEHSAAETTVRQTAAIATSSYRCEHSITTGFADINGTSSLDKKRLEIECGSGGDHDTPYHFTLPISTPQLLAWTRLQTRVRAGGLQP
jgi:hypothetical protein